MTIITHLHLTMKFCRAAPARHDAPYVSATSPRIMVETRQFILRYRSADKSLARPGRKQAAATEDFDFHIPYL